MSDLSGIVQSAQGGRVIENLAHRLGLAPWQTQAAVKALIPALSAGLQKAAEDPASLRPVIDAVTNPQHHAAFENAEAAHSEAAIERGKEIVDHLFGSPATAGQIAQLASRESFVRADILVQLLPILASIVAGGLFKTLENEGRGAILGQLAGNGQFGASVGRGAEHAPVRPGVARSPDLESQGGSGGLLALIGSLFGGLFGGKSRPEAGAASSSSPAPASKGNGLDAQALEEALDHIKKTFAPGAAVSADHQASLEDILR